MHHAEHCMAFKTALRDVVVVMVQLTLHWQPGKSPMWAWLPAH